MRTEIIKQTYQLPCADETVEALLFLANSAREQARSAELSCRKALNQNEDTTVELLPTMPSLQGSFADGLLAGTRALMHSATAALEAQLSVCSVLEAAIAETERRRDKEAEQIALADAVLSELEHKVDLLRDAVKAMGEPAGGGAYASGEARQLLDCLREANLQREAGQPLRKRAMETAVNLNYLTNVFMRAKARLDELAVLRQRTQEELDRVSALLSPKAAPGTEPILIEESLPLPTAAASAASSMAVAKRAPRAKTRPQEMQAEANTAPTQPDVPTLANPEMDENNGQPAIVDETSASEVGRKKRHAVWGMIWDFVKIIFIAFIIALLLRAFVFAVTRVEGTSMYPTLNNGDDLITSKISYYLDEPQRGDIIVLKAPDMQGEDYIKRVIALPNEELEIRDGAVYINGELLIEPYLQGLETEGDIHTIVPDGAYYVMGDNRGVSRDSRTDSVGPISEENIIGKAVFRFFPFSDIGGLY